MCTRETVFGAVKMSLSDNILSYQGNIILKLNINYLQLSLDIKEIDRLEIQMIKGYLEKMLLKANIDLEDNKMKGERKMQLKKLGNILNKQLSMIQIVEHCIFNVTTIRITKKTRIYPKFSSWNSSDFLKTVVMLHYFKCLSISDPIRFFSPYQRLKTRVCLKLLNLCTMFFVRL